MNYTLGLVVFKSDTMPQKMGISKNFEWSTDNHNKPPTAVGIGEVRVSLNIVILDNCHSKKKQIIGQLSQQANTMQPATLQVVSKTGAKSLGDWCITSINEDYEHFINGVPVKVDCQIELLRYQPIASSDKGFNEKQPNKDDKIKKNTNDWLFGLNADKSSDVDDQTALDSIR